MLIILTIIYTFLIYQLILKDFYTFLGPEAFFQDFPFVEMPK